MCPARVLADVPRELTVRAALAFDEVMVAQSPAVRLVEDSVLRRRPPLRRSTRASPDPFLIAFRRPPQEPSLEARPLGGSH